MTFEYGDPAVDLNTLATGSSPWFNLASGKRFNDDRSPTIESMMLDLDGDGLLDRLDNASTPATTGDCRATWMRNQGPATASAMPNCSPP